MKPDRAGLPANKLFAQQRVPVRYRVHEGDGWYAAVEPSGRYV
jgi:hypothetical protein